MSLLTRERMGFFFQTLLAQFILFNSKWIPRNYGFLKFHFLILIFFHFHFRSLDHYTSEHFRILRPLHFFPKNCPRNFTGGDYKKSKFGKLCTMYHVGKQQTSVISKTIIAEPNWYFGPHERKNAKLTIWTSQDHFEGQSVNLRINLEWHFQNAAAHTVIGLFLRNFHVGFPWWPQTTTKNVELKYYLSLNFKFTTVMLSGENKHFNSQASWKGMFVEWNIQLSQNNTPDFWPWS